MHTKKSLTESLKNMGLLPSDCLLVHASMKSIGDVEDRADGVLDVFMDYFSEGQFMMPAHTWAQMGDSYPVFDPSSEPACVGLLPNMFLARPGVLRSLHPTHSMAVFGQNAAQYIRGEEQMHTPCSPDGCWGRLKQIHAKILLIGVGHERNTYLHSVEEMLGVPDRLTEKPSEFFIRMPDHSLLRTSMHRHYNSTTDHISEQYPKLSQAFYDCGAAIPVSFGDASCILCDAELLYSVMKKVLFHNLNAVIEEKKIPEEWWKNSQ